MIYWLDIMLTKDDFKQLNDTFATKYDLQQLKEGLEETLVSKDDFRQAYGKLDQVLGEVLAIRQEQAMHTGSQLKNNSPCT